MRTLRLIEKLSPLALVLCLTAAAAGPAHAQCTSALFYADMKAPLATNFASGLIDVISPVTASTRQGCAGWFEAVVRIRIPNGCTAAIVLAEWEGLPMGYTLNLGDSPTNDAHAGDAGTTPHDAELWVLDENLSVANGGDPPVVVDNPLLNQHVSLTDSALKFLVKNQFVSWGQPYQFLQAPGGGNLFAIPDTTVAAADSRAIYLGLNRVIANNSRNGCGLRRVLVKFQQ